MPRNSVKKINKSTTSKYLGTYPQKFIEHCRKGKTTVEFVAEIGVDRDTFDRWCHTYKEMGNAKILGKELAEKWWVEQAQAYLTTYSSKDEGTTKFDTNLYKFIVGGRFGHGSKKKFKAPKFTDDIKKNYLLALNQIASGGTTQEDCELLMKIVATGMAIDEHLLMRDKIAEFERRLNEQEQSNFKSVEAFDDGA